MWNQRSEYKYLYSLIYLIFGLIILFSFIPNALADLDINAVAGQVKIDGLYAESGTEIIVQDITTGTRVITQVDGPNIPAFLRGEGRYDTGDMSEFNTGDRVTVSVKKSGIQGQSSKILVAGTTTIDVNAKSESPPRISYIPGQTGFEDVSWQLNLDTYLSDADTPKDQLRITVHNPYVDVNGHVLNFLYPEGITDDTVVVYVSDSYSTTSRQIAVTVEPVNDAPTFGEIPNVVLYDGSETQINLTEYVNDSDHSLSSLYWEISGGRIIYSQLQGSNLIIRANRSVYGIDHLIVTASDPEGASGNVTIRVEVQVNITTLVLTYESNILELRNKIKELEEEKADLNRTANSLGAEISNLESDNEELGMQLGRSKKKIDSLKADLSDGESQKIQYESEIAALNELNSNLSSRLAIAREFLKNMNSSYNDTIILLTKYEIKIQEMNKTIEALNLNLEKRGNYSKIQHGIIVDLTQENRNLEKLVNQKKQMVKILKNRTIALEERITIINQSRVSQILLLNESEESLKASLLKVNLLESELRELRQKIKNAKEKNISSPMNPVDSDFRSLRSTLARAAEITKRGSGVINRGMNNLLALLILLVIVLGSSTSIILRTTWFDSTLSDYLCEIGRKLHDSGQNLGNLRGKILKKRISVNQKRANKKKVIQKLDSSKFLDCDREYIEGLIRLGYIVEAEEEIEKRSL